MRISLPSSMSHFKARRDKFGPASLLILLGVGIPFTVVGIFALNSNRIPSGWAKVSGIVVDSVSSASDGSATYAPVVEYKAGDQSYTVTSSVRSTTHPTIGDRRQVAYNPTNPEQGKMVETIGTQWFLYLFPILGIFLIILGPALFIRSIRRSANIDQLVRTGHRIQGVLVDVRAEGHSDNNTYKIVVAAPDLTGAVQNYESDLLTDVGGLTMVDYRNNPVPIDVYLDSTDPKHYYVDISDIPNLTPERIQELITIAANKNQNK